MIEFDQHTAMTFIKEQILGDLTDDEVYTLCNRHDIETVDGLSDREIVDLARDIPRYMLDEIYDDCYTFSTIGEVLQYARESGYREVTKDLDTQIRERHDKEHGGHLLNCVDPLCDTYSKEM